MGIPFSSMFDKLFGGKKESKLLVLGLDNAGKTTLLYKLQLGDVVDTAPTIGFNCEQVDYKNVRFTAWDVGGQKKLRTLWRHYYQGATGLIWVVDSADTDPERLDDARETLQDMLKDDALSEANVLVLANKQDMRGAMEPSQIAEAMGMNKVRSHNWYVQGCCATTGHGLHEGLDWLVEALKKKK